MILPGYEKTESKEQLHHHECMAKYSQQGTLRPSLEDMEGKEGNRIGQEKAQTYGPARLILSPDSPLYR